jgi:hypothetical protein
MSLGRGLLDGSMREIKFRAWDTKNNEMRSWDDISRNWTMLELERQSNCIIMQSTGLKDKSGKDIWEGDILGGDFNREYSEVFFNEKWAQFMTRSHISTGSLNKIDHLEVIGNIYENPELLK